MYCHRRGQLTISMDFSDEQREVLRGESGAYMTPVLRIIVGVGQGQDFLERTPEGLGFYVWDILEALTNGVIELVQGDTTFTLRATDVPVERFMTFRRMANTVQIEYSTVESTGEVVERRVDVTLGDFVSAALECVESYLETCKELNPNYEADLDLKEIRSRHVRLREIA